FPAQAAVECEPWSGFPGVLDIKTDVVRSFEITLALCLSDGVDASEQKVRESQTGQLAAETERAVGELRVVLVRHAVDEVCAKGNLMRPADVIEIFRELIRQRVPLAFVRSAAAEAECIGDGQINILWHERRQIDTQIGRRKRIGPKPVV